MRLFVSSSRVQADFQCVYESFYEDEEAEVGLVRLCVCCLHTTQNTHTNRSTGTHEHTNTDRRGRSRDRTSPMKRYGCKFFKHCQV